MSKKSDKEAAAEDGQDVAKEAAPAPAPAAPAPAPTSGQRVKGRWV